MKFRNILLWIEDNPELYLELIHNTANKKGLELVLATGISALARKLEELNNLNNEETKISIKGIILDLLIYGEPTLESFGRSDIILKDNAYAGEYLLKTVLRNESVEDDNSIKFNLSKIPILILTVMSQTKLTDFSSYGDLLELTHKYELDETEERKIKSWINAL